MYICLYMSIYMSTYVFIYTCTDMQCKCDLNQKAGRGDWVRAQRLPPKQNDTICFHRQSYM